MANKDVVVGFAELRKSLVVIDDIRNMVVSALSLEDQERDIAAKVEAGERQIRDNAKVVAESDKTKQAVLVDLGLTQTALAKANDELSAATGAREQQDALTAAAVRECDAAVAKLDYVKAERKRIIDGIDAGLAASRAAQS